MSELLSAAQMRAIERAAIESGEVTGLELMERAGKAVVEAIFEEWPGLAGALDHAGEAPAERLAVVLCGPGNNGGDGFVVARLLRGLGWAVKVFLFGDPAKLPADAKENYSRWLALGEVGTFDEISETLYDRAALTIEAVFGTGLTRAIPQKVFNTLNFAAVAGNSRAKPRPPIVAIDVPSGFDADSGKPLLSAPEDEPDDFYRAALTVSFGAAKIGHYLSPFFGGRLVVKPIGVEKRVARAYLDFDVVELLRLDEVKHIDLLGRKSVALPILNLSKSNRDHKFSNGHALVLSGGVGKGGAARLAARGALRIGAGLVTLGCPEAALAENAARLDAVMLRFVEGADDLAEVLADPRINALCLGPGLGVGPDRRGLVEVALKSGRSCVLDADALSIFENKDELFALCHRRVVLTPHGGEFARLFPDIAAKLAAPALRGPAYSKVDATREAAARAGCVVLFKGADTVIADEEGECSINAALNERAAPWLATAGSGDVLAGFITGLLARGFSAMDAAETGAWLHVEAARAFGPGLISEDLPEMLPKVFRRLQVD